MCFSCICVRNLCVFYAKFERFMHLLHPVTTRCTRWPPVAPVAPVGTVLGGASGSRWRLSWRGSRWRPILEGHHYWNPRSFAI